MLQILFSVCRSQEKLWNYWRVNRERFCILLGIWSWTYDGVYKVLPKVLIFNYPIKFISININLINIFRKVPFDADHFQEAQISTLNPNFRGAVVSSNDEIVHLNKLNYKNFSYTVCNEMILTVPVVFYLHKDSYLTEVFSEKIDDLKSAGLIDYWISKYVDSKYLNIDSKDKSRKKLNYQELSGAFQLFAVGLICSVIAFMIENLMSLRSKRKIRTVYCCNEGL